MRVWISASDAIGADRVVGVAGETGVAGEAGEAGDSTVGVAGTDVSTWIVGTCKDKGSWIRISRQYSMIQRVPKIHNFESGLMTLHLLTNLAGRWRNRNTRYLGEGVMQDTVTPEYVNWFFYPMKMLGSARISV
ncbi:hypothetical protein JCGZ_18172 [Jatropha curcas]|uniref:Uncharacterized protein n=1 Tax=Jatropha curcas TaxID=180498 RepID=A0A067LAV7_JATCU|nr:hypothetical protein JCGZ_18172 [Jatropha curcas]